MILECWAIKPTSGKTAEKKEEKKPNCFLIAVCWNGWLNELFILDLYQAGNKKKAGEKQRRFLLKQHLLKGTTPNPALSI